LAQRLAEGWQVRLLAPAQGGLAMLRLVDGALSEPFNLGEIPFARAHVELLLPSGTRAEGAAQVMHGDPEFARSLATLDAIAAGDLPGAHEVLATIQRGAALLANADLARKATLAATKVDFSLMTSAPDSNAEEHDDA